MKKIIRELDRLYSKITDYFFLTQNFHKYQIRYSKIYSNKYILSKDQYSFIHPPKSAGTSINTYLRDSGIDIYKSAHNLVSLKCKPDNYKYITVIRNPIDRIKSFYEMQLNDRKLSFHNHAQKSLKFFITKIKMNQNCLCKFILGNLEDDINEEKFIKVIENLRKFYFIIDFENIDRDIDVLKKKLNIDKEMQHIGKKKIKKQIIYSNKDVDLIKENNIFDIKLYNLYKNNFHNINQD